MRSDRGKKKRRRKKPTMMHKVGRVWQGRRNDDEIQHRADCPRAQIAETEENGVEARMRCPSVVARAVLPYK